MAERISAEADSVTVDQLIAEFLDRRDRGEATDATAFVAAHPEQAAALRSFLEGMKLLRDVGGSPAEMPAGVRPAPPRPGAVTRSHRLDPDETATAPPVVALPSGDAVPLPERFGRYKILRLLGQGGMGAVYLARDTGLNRDVALKIPLLGGPDSTDLVRRFYREAQAAATLQHPNICPVHDVGEIDGRHYLTMAFIEGKPLTKFIGPRKSHTPRQVAVIVRKLALALAEAHKHGVVHRDLKPANIMVDTRNEPVVMDFGLARRLSGPAEAQLTQQGMIVGSPAYMSPEQILGDQSRVGPQSDVWSLGVILYELLTGRLPFQGGVMQLIGAIQHADPPAPSSVRPGVDPQLEAICLKMLARPLDRRYQSMHEVAQALACFLKAPSKGDAPPSPTPSASGPALLTVPASEPSLSAKHAEQPAPANPSSPPGQHQPPIRRPPKWPIATAAGLLGVLLLWGTIAFLDRNGADKADHLAGKQTPAAPAPPRAIEDAMATAPPAATTSESAADAAPKADELPSIEPLLEVRYPTPKRLLGADISRDGSLVAASRDAPGNGVRLWDQKGQMLGDFPGWIARISPDGGTLLTSNYSQILVYDIATGTLLKTLNPKVGIWTFKPMQTGTRLFLGSAEGGQVWDWSSGKKITAFPVTLDTRGAATPDGKFMLQQVNGKPPLRVLSLETGDVVTGFEAIRMAPQLQYLSNDGTGLLVRDGTKLAVLDVATGGTRDEIEVGAVPWGIFSGDARLVLAMSETNQVARLWEVGRSRWIASLKLPGPVDESRVDVSMSADGKYAAMILAGSDKVFLFRLPEAAATAWHGWPADAPPPAIAPFTAGQARPHQDAWAKYLGVPVEYTNSIGMKFRLIPPGEFMMGSTPEEIEETLGQIDITNRTWREYVQSEAPRHKVILTKPFYLGVNEVTQGEYEKVMGKNPSYFAKTGSQKEMTDKVEGLDTSGHPVENVSWNDAAEFSSRLSLLEKRKPFYLRAGESVTALDGTGYRLPTEAEWEFGGRAGTTMRFWIGDTEQDLKKAGWFLHNSGGRTHAAGELMANPFGLCDVHGNVFEWVEDIFDPGHYGRFGSEPAIDPKIRSSAGARRLIRGGRWGHAAFASRSSTRYAESPVNRSGNLGFRMALEIGEVRTSPSQRPE